MACRPNAGSVKKSLRTRGAHDIFVSCLGLVVPTAHPHPLLPERSETGSEALVGLRSRKGLVQAAPGFGSGPFAFVGTARFG